MKKINKLIPLLALMPFLSGISSCTVTPQKVDFLYGDMTISDVEDIKYADLKEIIRNEENALVVVEPANGCMCWSMFHPIIQKYLTETKIPVKHLKYSEFYGEDDYGMNIKDGYTTFSIFKSGKLDQTVLSDNAVLKDVTKFYEFMEKHVVTPRIFNINKNQLDEIYRSSKKSVVYIARNKCGDCSYVDANFMGEYFKDKTSDHKLYKFDAQSIYDADPNHDTTWVDFKNTYGLSSTNNSNYGFSTGYVPTFLLVSGTPSYPIYHSGAVYFNDSLTYDKGELKVTKTYYSSDRLTYLQYLNNDPSLLLENLKVPVEDAVEYQTNYYWDQAKAAKYHDGLLTKFLDYALPLATHEFK